MNIDISRPSSSDRIDSRAICSSKLRSSGLYSGTASAWAQMEDEVSDGGNIALLAPAKDERPPVALDYVSIDFSPERNKVVPGRNQRNPNHKPDRQVSDPMHWEDVRPHGPLPPAMIENHRDHGNNLHKHFEFAQIAGFNGESLRSRNRSQAAYQEFPADNYDGNPCGNQPRIELDQSDERSSDQQLVGERIKQDPHGGNLPATPRDVAIDSVSDRGRNKERRSEQLLFTISRGEAVRGEHPDQQWDHANPDERNGIGKIHQQRPA